MPAPDGLQWERRMGPNGRSAAAVEGIYTSESGLPAVEHGEGVACMYKEYSFLPPPRIPLIGPFEWLQGGKWPGEHI